MSRTFAEGRVHSPANLDAALEFLANHAEEGWKPLAGGTDALVPIYRDSATAATPWLDLQRLRPELRFVRTIEEGFEIGALATVSDLLENDELIAHFPILRACCLHFASPAIRNRATIGGNIGNGSPASDLAPVLLALGAEIEFANRNGRRRIALDEFWTGYKRSVLAQDELIVGVRIPFQAIRQNAYVFRKVAPRASNSISIANIAAVGSVRPSGAWSSVGMAMGCASPYPLRLTELETAVEGRRFDGDCRTDVIRILNSSLRPITDHRATAQYRTQALTNLAIAFLEREIGFPH